MDHSGRFACTDDVAAFVRQLCESEDSGNRDVQLAIGVDADLDLVGVAVKGEDGAVDRLGDLRASVVGLLAEEMGATALFLVFVRAGLRGMPDPAEARRLVTLAEECERQGTRLVDGVVVTDRGYWSLRGVAAMSGTGNTGSWESRRHRSDL